jgi:hypothetical protein
MLERTDVATNSTSRIPDRTFTDVCNLTMHMNIGMPLVTLLVSFLLHRGIPLCGIPVDHLDFISMFKALLSI